MELVRSLVGWLVQGWNVTSKAIILPGILVVFSSLSRQTLGYVLAVSVHIH
jgi:hypothetical protein